MNVNSFGNRLVFGTGYNGAGYDMSSFTGLELTFTRPDKTTFTVTNPAVALGVGTYTLPSGQTYTANQYVTYSFLDGEVTIAGAWQVRLTYLQSNATPEPISFPSNIANFMVGP